RAQFEKVAHELRVGLTCKSPRQDHRIEKVPVASRQYPGAVLRLAGDKSFRCKNLNGLAIGASRNVQRFGILNLSGQPFSRLDAARYDRGAEVMSYRSPQPPARSAPWGCSWRKDALDAFGCRLAGFGHRASSRVTLHQRFR